MLSSAEKRGPRPPGARLGQLTPLRYGRGPHKERFRMNRPRPAGVSGQILRPRAFRPSAPAIALLALWLGLVAWRPLVLGFYHDDWWALARPAVLTPLADLIDTQRSRALLALLTWCLRSLFGGVAAAWQILAAAGNLICAVLIAAVVDRLCPPHRDGWSNWAGAGAGALWLAAPWSLAYTAWPVMSLPLLSIALLAASAMLLLPPRCTSPAAGAGAALPYLAGCLLYEAVWGAFVPVALIASLMRLKARAPLRPVLAYALAAGAGQIVLLVLNRLLSVGLHAKHVYAAAADLVTLSFKIALPQMAETIGAPLPLAAAAAGVLTVTFAVAAFRSRDVVRPGIVAACLLGIAIAVVLHALAGYGTQWTDLMARTAMVPTFWLCVALGAMLQAVLAGGRILRPCAALAGAALVAALAVATLAQTREWAVGWREERAVLATFPADEARKLAPGIFLVADLPRDGSPRGQFDAYWDITGGLVATYPDLARLLLRGEKSRATVLRPRDWYTEWDGSKLSQGWCPDRLLWSYDATGAVLWDQKAGTLAPIAPGTRMGCGKARAAP
jgi:hypothetical protein